MMTPVLGFNMQDTFSGRPSLKWKPAESASFFPAMWAGYMIRFCDHPKSPKRLTNPDAAVNRLEVRPGVSQTQIDTIAAALSPFPDRTQFSIALIDDSATVFYGAVRSNDTLKTINNSEAVFEIGSLSKVFTSTLLADLVHRQKLQLDQPINEYLNFPLHRNISVTFKQLSSHTSGLPRIPDGFVWESLLHMENPYKDYDEDKLREYLTEEMELKAEPGTEFQYSNIGAGILGYTLTQIEQKSYEELLQEIIAGPLQMPSTTTQREKFDGRLLRGLSKRGKPTSYWDFGAIPGAGAILSTAKDLVKFARANFDPDNEVLALQQQKTFTIDEDRDMALGWFILKRESGEMWHWHNGGTGGFRSSKVLDVAGRKAVVILSNISAGHSHARTVDRLSYALLESLPIGKVRQSGLGSTPPRAADFAVRLIN